MNFELNKYTVLEYDVNGNPVEERIKHEEGIDLDTVTQSKVEEIFAIQGVRNFTVSVRYVYDEISTVELV